LLLHAADTTYKQVKRNSIRSSDPEAMFEQFYGGKPDIDPLLEHRGLK
jgi:Zn-dependent oligopeptidase